MLREKRVRSRASKALLQFFTHLPKESTELSFQWKAFGEKVVMEVPLLPCKVVSVSKTSKTAFVYLVEVLNFVCIYKLHKVSQKRINLPKSVN